MGRDRVRAIGLWSSAALALACGSAAAQPAPNDDEIIVTAPSDQMQIDRRTYTIRNDPTAQATNMLDVLGRVPSVSVAPSGAITLLGASGVTIQINGQPAPEGSLDQLLRAMPAGDVERIEVITNPSAQYARSGTGGIINIVTRQRFARGAGGTLYAGTDTLGGASLSTSPSWSHNAWTLSGRLSLSKGAADSDVDRERHIFATDSDTSEIGNMNADYDFEGGFLQGGYAPDAQRSVTLSLNSTTFHPDIDQFSTTSDAASSLFSQSKREDSTIAEHGLYLLYRQQNAAQPRETLTFNAGGSRKQTATDDLLTLSPAGAGPENQTATLFRRDMVRADAKLDYERPFEGQRFLTLGAEFEHYGNDITNGLQTLAGPPGPADFSDGLQRRQEIVSAYSTHQFAAGDWTWLPGLRFENFRQEVISTAGDIEHRNARLFPTLHVRRALGADINLDVSYSSRIQHPGVADLDPAVHLSDSIRGYAGNPALRPTTTDAYEANLTYQNGATTYGVTFYDRVSDDVVSRLTQQVGDLSLSVPVNAGQSEDRGLQLIARAPLGHGWRYSLSANLQSHAFDGLSDGAVTRRNELEYSGNAQLEYRDRNENEIGADQLQLGVQFQGPRHFLQGDADAFATARISWRRRLTNSVSSILTFNDVFDSADQRSSITTDGYTERSLIRSPGRTLSLTFAYQFGAAAQRPLQDAPTDPGAGAAGP